MTRIGRAVAAIAALAAALLSAAAAAEDGLDRALSLASEGRHADAQRLLGPLLESQPGDPQLRLLHGILEMQEGRRDEAIAVFSALAREHPDMFEAHNNLAVAYVEEGRLEEARAILAAILERSPSSVGYRNLGDIYVQLARRALARSRDLGGRTAGDADDGRTPGGGLVAARDAAVPRSGAAGAEGQASAGAPEKPAHAVAAHAEFCVVTAEFSDMSAIEEAQQWLQARGAESARVVRGSRETVRGLPGLPSALREPQQRQGKDGRAAGAGRARCRGRARRRSEECGLARRLRQRGECEAADGAARGARIRARA